MYTVGHDSRVSTPAQSSKVSCCQLAFPLLFVVLLQGGVTSYMVGCLCKRGLAAPSPRLPVLVAVLPSQIGRSFCSVVHAK